MTDRTLPGMPAAAVRNFVFGRLQLVSNTIALSECTKQLHTAVLARPDSTSAVIVLHLMLLRPKTYTTTVPVAT